MCRVYITSVMSHKPDKNYMGCGSVVGPNDPSHEMILPSYPDLEKNHNKLPRNTYMMMVSFTVEFLIRPSVVTHEWCLISLT